MRAVERNVKNEKTKITTVIDAIRNKLVTNFWPAGIVSVPVYSALLQMTKKRNWKQISDKSMIFA